MPRPCNTDRRAKCDRDGLDDRRGAARPEPVADAVAFFVAFASAIALAHTDAIPIAPSQLRRDDE